MIIIIVFIIIIIFELNLTCTTLGGGNSCMSYGNSVTLVRCKTLPIRRRTQTKERESSMCLAGDDVVFTKWAEMGQVIIWEMENTS